MLLLLLSFLLSSDAQASSPLAGLCPFEPTAAKKLFAADLVRDLGWAEIENGFRSRERWYGSCTKAEKAGRNRWRLQYAGAAVPFSVKAKSGLILEYSFGLGEVAGDDWAKLSKFIAKQWPESSLYVGRLGRRVAGHREVDPLSVADNARLFLLAATEGALRSGKLRPEQKVKVTKARVADPMDQLAERVGDSFSVRELKELMLSHQDRTAADLLLELLGRGAVEREARGLAPFLSRREAAWLHTLSKGDMKALTREDALATAGRLNDARKVPPLPKERFDVRRVVAWLASTEDLCRAAVAWREVPELKNSLSSRGFREDRGLADGIYAAARDFGVSQITWTTGTDCFSFTLNLDRSEDEVELEEVTGRASKLWLEWSR